MIFAQLYYTDTNKTTEVWEVLEGSGNPADTHKLLGICTTEKGEWKQLSGAINIEDIQEWKRG